MRIKSASKGLDLFYKLCLCEFESRERKIVKQNMGLICFEYDDIIFQPKKCMVVRAKQPHLPPMASHEFLKNFSNTPLKSTFKKKSACS